MTSFVTYLRVSTDKQGRSGLGLEAQRAAVAAHAASTGGNVVAEFVEVESGRKSNRAQLAAALAACRGRRAVLLIAKLDRLARNVAFVSRLMEAGVEFVAADMPTVNKLTIHILAAVAEEETRMISARTKAALTAAKARGVKLGNPNLQPGTRAQALAASRVGVAAKVAKADELAADLAPVIASIRAEGITPLAAIAAALTERGIPTPSRRGAWHAATLQRVLARAA
jgi:DNA invertase Pin-like site-specific DNA recombinase